MSGEDEKWACEYCTYENWPSAIKCTLCRGMRSPQLIADHHQIGRFHERNESVPASHPALDGGAQDSTTDNLNMINFCDATPPPLGGGVNINTATAPTTNSKWLCSQCTYQNWPKSLKCTQCLTQRPRKTKSTTSPASSPLLGNPDYDEPPDIFRSSPAISPECPPIKELHNDRNRTLSCVVASKWMCPACTYENWPKSLKCILCYAPRLRFSDAMSSIACSRSPEGEENLRNGGLRRSPGSGGLEYSDPSSSSEVSCDAGTSASATANNYENEMRLKQLRKCMREVDWPWLNACIGIVNGDPNPVEAYLSAGGDPSRQLSQSEVNLLNRPSAFDAGYTLVHLAIRFHRDDLLTLLLAAVDATCGAHKRMPSHVSPELAADIRKHLSASFRQRKGNFPCQFVSELATFALPAEIDDLSSEIQEQLFDELLDRDVQKELEEESPIINWSLELTERLGSRLYALWNRTAGDCLLDSVLQATWGIFDGDNTLRRALSDSLHDAASIFYPRWKEYETMQARLMHFALDESQCQHDWALLLSLASQPGASLEQMHIFALAHILRRPIIVYGVKYVKSFRGEAIGYARFEGVYLPLLWEQSFCWKSPIALGYTRGHFSALIPMEPDTCEESGAGANIRSTDDLKLTFLPLNSSDGKLLPVHFLASSEIGHEEDMLKQWLDCCIMDGGILVAQQRIQRRPLLVAQMVEEWLNHYRRACYVPPPAFTRGSALPRGTNGPVYASDGDSDDE